MFNVGSTLWLPAKNADTLDIPVFAMVELSEWDNLPETQPGVADFHVSVVRPTENNLTCFGVSGPKLMPSGGNGYVCVDGITAVRNARGIANIGTGVDSFDPIWGFGMTPITPANTYATTLCRFSRGMRLSRSLRAGSGSVADGSYLSGTDYAPVTERAFGVPGVGGAYTLQAAGIGLYLFGFSVTCNASTDANPGSLMKLGLYDSTNAAYTGHYASAEDYWHVTTGTATTYDNQNRANIAMTGLVSAAAASTEFQVRNLSGFPLDYADFNFWMAQHE